LFEHLTRLDAVRLTPYDLEYHGTWSIDLDGLERALSSRARAVLCVHPNNPTGSFVSAGDFERVATMCASREVAIVADEVFADYDLVPGGARGAARMLDQREVLVFSLGGLSKSIGLPQVKLGWIAIAGPDRLVREALSRLEFACDMYLGVSTPVQLAAPALLEGGASIRRQIQARLRTNYEFEGMSRTSAGGCRVLRAEGGWYSVMQVPAFEPEEEMALTLLTDDQVFVHPGYFYDFPREAYFVVSLLAPEAEFREGVSRILRRFSQPGAPHLND
jgi:aspartate/methionine/tyrosine aminotransferase